MVGLTALDRTIWVRIPASQPPCFFLKRTDGAFGSSPAILELGFEPSERGLSERTSKQRLLSDN